MTKNFALTYIVYLSFDHIFKRDEREREAVRRLRAGLHRAGACRTVAAAKGVCADDEMLVRVQRFPRANKVFPPATVAVFLG